MKEIRFAINYDTENALAQDEMEILFVLSGRIAIMLTDMNFVLGPEDFVIFNPFEYREMYQEAGNHTLSLFISQDILQQTGLGTIRCCSYLQPEQSDYLNLIRAKIAAAFKSYMNEPDRQRLYILSEIFGLCGILKQQFETTDNLKNGRYMQNDKIREILLYINQHFRENLSLQQVADNVYLSKSYVSRLFKEQTGTDFSDYLRAIRIEKARFLLLSTDYSITQISESCGFANINTMTANFKAQYNQTPSEYKKNHKKEEEFKTGQSIQGKVPYLRLLKYAVLEETVHLPNKQDIQPAIIKANVKRTNGELNLCHRETIAIGWANFLLLENVRNEVRRAVKDIGFKYITFHGLLDDDLDVYHEDANGTLWLNFTYIDMIIDFLLSTGLTPWIELCFTPSQLRPDTDNTFGGSYVQLPTDLDRWSFLVEEVILHLAETYGTEQVKTWNFSILPALFIYYNVFTLEEYLEYYQRTYDSIKKILPDAVIFGGCFDVGHMKEDGEKDFRCFLEYVRKNDCMPASLCFQDFSCDYNKNQKKSEEKRVRANDVFNQDEPVPPSPNPDWLRDDIAYLRRVLMDYQMEHYPIRIDSWNSTIWGRDLGNDTCFKAAFIVKNFLENRENVSALNYCYLTDNTEHKTPNSNLYYGGNGLITYDGIPKAPYYAYCLMNRLGNMVIDQGEGYLITRSADGKQIQFLLYHYCHYDMNVHASTIFPEEEQRTIDRYYEFQDLGIRNFRFYLSGLNIGIYEKESYFINRENGSSYDKWMDIGAPRKVNKEQRAYLENTSGLGYKYEKMYVDNTEESLVAAILQPHEVRLICLTFKGKPLL